MSNSSSSFVIRYDTIRCVNKQIIILRNYRVAVVLCVVVFIFFKLSRVYIHHVGTCIVHLIECECVLTCFYLMNDLWSLFFC